ncbi:MAG: HAMP domain-containing histidine kinase [Chloroflexi bacterium]|nr:HAMP domain-containing histidine kinase [Chloroflexota bacterium]
MRNNEAQQPIFYNWPLINKLIAGFGVPLVLVALAFVASLVSGYFEDEAEDDVNAARAKTVASQNLTTAYQAADNYIADFTLQLLQYGYDTALTDYENYQAQIAKVFAEMEALQRQYSADDADREQQARLDDLGTDLQTYDDNVNWLIGDLLAERGSLDSGKAGEFYACLLSVSEDYDVSQALNEAYLYIRFFDEPSALSLPGTLTSLGQQIDEDDTLSTSDRAALQDKMVAATAAFAVLGFHDTQLEEGFQGVFDDSDLFAGRLRDLTNDQQAQLDVALDDLDRVQYFRRRVVPVLFVLAFVFAIGSTLAIGRLFTRPITRLTQTAGEIAAGKYDQRVAVPSGDEIGKLSQSFNAMVEAVASREQDLKDHAEKLRVAEIKATESVRLKSEFLATMSHELRTPLNAIIGFSDMLLMGMSGDLNDKQRHQLNRLQANGERLLELVNDILDLTRIETRRVEIVAEPFAPQSLAHRLQAQMDVLAKEKQLSFETTVDPALPAQVVGDERRIEQVVVNLLSNAFKFTEKGSVKLVMRPAPAADNEPSQWCIAVTDTGIGIPAHAHDLIFEEFRQLDGSSTRRFGGSGLGLAIARNLARLMHGRIELTSEPMQGSTFTLFLPLHPPPSEAPTATDSQPATAAPAEPSAASEQTEQTVPEGS